LPLGSVGYEHERTATGGVFIWVVRAAADKLFAERRQGEEISDVICGSGRPPPILCRWRSHGCPASFTASCLMCRSVALSESVSAAATGQSLLSLFVVVDQFRSRRTCGSLKSGLESCAANNMNHVLAARTD
jgi:hypothetical protein